MMIVELMMKKVVERITGLAILGIACLVLTIPSLSWSADDFKVTLLGTGTPAPSPERFGPSTLVEAGGQRLLFDMGRGVTIRLWQKGIPFGAVDAHFLTHLHSDHVNGLPDLWLTGWIQTPYGSRKKPFTVYGPPGTRKMMAGLWEAFSEDRRIRTEDEHFPLSGIEFDARDVKPGVVYERNGVVVTTFDVDHGDHIKPAYGYKVTYQGRSVVISGDTRQDANVERAAKGTDLLIHEVAMFPEKLLVQLPVYKAVYEHHISPEQAGKLFAATRPKLAVYTHIILRGEPKMAIPAPTPAELLAATAKNYDGRVVLGADLMGFKIEDNGVSIIEPPRK
jgi:ribonuclease Z